MTDEATAVQAGRSWPFQEAAKVLKRLERSGNPKGFVLFETGYGPSGLPHIGTFGEVARTTMVRHAFGRLSGIETRLLAFSDDMDGLRKVPDNVPNRELLATALGRPLTRVPDPFGTHESFGHHNNARLRSFLDRFGFDYAFASATDYYTSGRFDTGLLRMLACHDEVRDVILPTLGPERRETYSPFLPVCPRTGQVLQVAILETRPEAGTIVYRDPETGGTVELPVTGGNVKCQWKADWALRWYALQVDYEMSGKDLIDSVRLSSRICRVLGGEPPETLTYELFLDEQGRKISKSKGNGLSIEDWLTYGTQESLAYYMYQQPQRAKRLYFDVIPKAVDDYLAELAKYPEQDEAARLDNPVWHIHSGNPPAESTPVGFALLLNLVGAANAHDKAVLWGFIRRYAPDATPQSHPLLDRLVGHAIAYYHDRVAPERRRRPPTAAERPALEELAAALAALPEDTDAETLQNEVYEVGKRHGFASLRDWFRALYEVLFGQQQGPRMGSFAALYGVAATAALIRDALDRPAEADAAE